MGVGALGRVVLEEEYTWGWSKDALSACGFDERLLRVSMCEDGMKEAGI